MKIKRFNEHVVEPDINRNEEIEDIMNIARDEGLLVYNPLEAIREGFDECWYIFRYDLDENNYSTGDPLMDNDEFINLVMDIYDRLDNLGVINHQSTNRIGDGKYLYNMSGKFKDIGSTDITTIKDSDYVELNLFWTLPDDHPNFQAVNVH